MGEALEVEEKRVFTGGPEAAMVAHVHPDCVNASNPYHECSNYCLQKISERKTVSGGVQKADAAGREIHAGKRLLVPSRGQGFAAEPKRSSYVLLELLVFCRI